MAKLALIKESEVREIEVFGTNTKKNINKCAFCGKELSYKNECVNSDCYNFPKNQEFRRYVEIMNRTRRFTK